MTQVAAAPAAATVRSRIAARLNAYGAPTGNRLIGIDVARGLAVLGMFAAHTLIVDPFDWGTPSTWADVVNGRSSILFATLAGVSIALISGRRVPPSGTELLQARLRIFARAVLIFAIGGLLEFLGTSVAVILPMYALLFVLALPFLRWSPRALFLLAGALALAMPLAQVLLATGANEFGAGGAIVDLFVTGTYPGMIWVVFVLLGLAIGRLDLASLRVRVTLLLAGLALVIIGYGAGAVADAIAPPEFEAGSSIPGSSGSSPFTLDPQEGVPATEVDFDGLVCDRWDESVTCYPEGYYDYIDEETPPEKTTGEAIRAGLASLFTASAHSGTISEVLGSGGFAIVVLVLSLLAATRRVLRWLLFPVAAIGSMALSAYSAHIVALSVLGMTGETQGAPVFLAFAVCALVVCSLWAVLLGRGPLERLLTWVSHRAARRTPPDPRAEGDAVRSIAGTPPTGGTHD